MGGLTTPLGGMATPSLTTEGIFNKFQITILFNYNKITSV